VSLFADCVTIASLVLVLKILRIPLEDCKMPACCLPALAAITKTTAAPAARVRKKKHTACFGHYPDCEAHTDVWMKPFPTWNQTNEKRGDAQ
jgi:hypothetical protein